MDRSEDQLARPEWFQHFPSHPPPTSHPRTRIPRRPKVVRAVFTKAGPWVTLPMKVLIFELSTRQAKLPQIKAGTSTTSPAIACAVVKASNWISFWIRAPTDTTTTTGMRVLLAVWRDASCVQRECGMRQCQGRGPYVRATLGALSQVAPGRLRKGTHMDPGCRRMLMGQHGLGTGDPRITRCWICNVVPALSVSAYHTCCDRTRAPQGCGAQRNDSSKGTYMCGGCGPRVGARGPGHTQRHWGACTLGGAREHGLAKPHRVSGPWGGTRAGARGTIP